tara:strand:- start:7400 stop:7660 length:261 start_codon:yes stop_codon:yes gene_type:complete
MKSKFLIPLLAVIFTTAMSFTTARTAADPNNDYVLTNSGLITVSEVDCGSGAIPCEATVDGEGPYPIFDDQNMTNRKVGSGEVQEL